MDLRKVAAGGLVALASGVTAWLVLAPPAAPLDEGTAVRLPRPRHQLEDVQPAVALGDDVARVLTRAKDPLEVCWREARAARPDLPLRASLAIAVDGSGRVVAVRSGVAGDTAALDGCLAGALADERFDATSPRTLRAPVQFEP